MGYDIWEKCSADSNCRESTGDVQGAASGRDYFYMVQHGAAGPPQEYVDALKPSGMGAMDVSNAVWMMVPCYGGVIDYSSTSDSIVLTFLKKGGAIHMSSTSTNCCSVTGITCTDKIDYVSASEGGPGAGVGALYYKIAKNSHPERA